MQEKIRSKRSRNRTWTRRLTAAMSLALLIAMTVTLPGCAPAPDQLTVVTAQAKSGQIATAFELTGALMPIQSADLTAPFSGKIAAINVKAGDLVTQGQVLGSLDLSQLQGQLRQAQANYQSSQGSLAQSRVSLENARNALERSQSLFQEGAVSKQQLDSDQKAYDLARLQYENNAAGGAGAANASVESIKVQISNASIKSPFAGVVVSVNMTAGETASLSAPLFTVADMSVLKLKGTVPQEALPYLKSGDPVDISVDIYPGTVFPGTVTEIGTMSVSPGTYFPVEISLQNGTKMSAGLSAHASIQASGQEQVLVPVSAVVEHNGEAYLFLIQNGMALKQSVSIGLRNDTQIEILQGIKAGDVVAVTNANHLFDQMPVKIVEQ